MRLLRFIFFFSSLCFQSSLLANEGEGKPEDIEFRRQAVTRLIFDESHRIPLSSLRPAKVIDLDLMHPELLADSSLRWDFADAYLKGSSPQKSASSLRWVGGFNPFATYDLELHQASGDGAIALTFQHARQGDRLSAGLQIKDGKPVKLTWNILSAGVAVPEKTWPVPPGTSLKGLTLRAQMSAVGVNLFLESEGKATLIGFSDFAKQMDLRERSRIQQMDFAIQTELQADAQIMIKQASSYFSPGSGQADIRAITDEEGKPLLEDGRLWMTMTLRGRALPHPLQGVFSLNPSVFDLRFEGVIVFDMDDGLFRNELASHLFRDSKTGEWRGWTTGFSALGGAGKTEEKTILGVSSTRDPRKGFSIMKARPIGIAGAHEDPHGIYDKEAGKWRLLLCEHGKNYRAGMWQSDHWDRGFTRLAGPVEMDSTGTMIQQIGAKRYALFGSADRKIYIRSYPDLGPVGELQISLPPWNENNGSRIWPNVIPLPEGYPAPYIALMMDRVNFPEMPKPNWTYGALYLYHGHVLKKD